MLSHEALQWLCLGMALANKTLAEQVRKISREAFDPLKPGPAKALHEAMSSTEGVVAWLVQETGLVPADGQHVSERILESLDDFGRKMNQRRLLQMTKDQAIAMSAGEFKEWLARLLEKIDVI